MLHTYSILISGKVQGVFFRQSAVERATMLEIKGTVTNQEDDTVLIIATGTVEQLDQLVTWCKHGPPKAKVEQVTVTEVPLREFSNFSINRR
jgi:acylphosphatase